MRHTFVDLLRIAIGKPKRYYGARKSAPNPTVWKYRDVHAPTGYRSNHPTPTPPVPPPVPTPIPTPTPTPTPTPSPTPTNPPSASSVISLRSAFPPVQNQGSFPSCVAFGTTAAMAYEKGLNPLSEMQVYYDIRLREGTQNQVAGVSMIDGPNVALKTGAASEISWPYYYSRWNQVPPATVMAEAATHKIGSYSMLAGRNDFLACLADGHPFIVGLTIYQSFEGSQATSTGIIPMPINGETFYGGHCVLIIGHDPNYQGRGDHYEFRNCWGSGWGDSGNGWLPAAYLESPSLAYEPYTFRK